MRAFVVGVLAVALLTPVTAGQAAERVSSPVAREAKAKAGVSWGKHGRRAAARRRRWSGATARVQPAPPADPCARQGPAAARMEGDRTSVRPGEQLGFTVHNTGATCLTYGADYLLERRSGDAWEQAGEPLAFPAWGATLLPGQTYRDAARIPADLQPGRYRVTKLMGGTVPTSHEFDVVAG